MASELKVDKFTGVTTAGSILVTGEGNSTTTNLQQGLAKAWFNVNQEGTQAFSDSFNCASLTDNGTGNSEVTFTNAFGNDSYALGGMARDSSGGSFGIVRISDPMSTTNLRFIGESHDDTNIDCETATVIANGDLA